MYALSALSVGSENPYIVRYYSGWIEDSKLFIVVIITFIRLIFTDGALQAVSQELFNEEEAEGRVFIRRNDQEDHERCMLGSTRTAQ